MRSFLNELKRRSVFRAAAAYSVVAWVMAQGSAVVLPAFDAPDWALRSVIIVLLAGLPLTLLLAWIYELTPQGLRRTPANTESGIEDRTPRVLDSIIILGLVVAVIFTGLARDAFSDGADWLLHTAGAPARDEQRLPRIAVLPFHSANTDLEAERFSHGLAAEIANGLERMQGMQVIGMTSTETLESRPMETAEIAALLDVDWLLEGTVRRNGDSASIDVQLVKTQDGSEALTLSFKPGSGELVDVRNDILEAVAAKLGKEIGIDEDEPLQPVYAEWLTLLGRLRHATPEDLAAAQGAAAKLAERAPKAGLLRAAHALAVVNGSLPEGAEDYAGKAEQARRLLDEALTLSPNSLRVLQWRADIDSRLSHWRGSNAANARIMASIEHALELYPRSSDLLATLAAHAQRFGDYPLAVEQARRTLERDPLSATLRSVLVESLAAQGRFKEARNALAGIMDGEHSGALRQQLQLEIAMLAGDPERALEVIQDLNPVGHEYLTEHLRVLSALGDSEAIEARLAALDGKQAAEWRKAWQAAINGDHPAAFTTLRRLLNAGEPGDARRLGILAVQAGETAAALEIFGPHFVAWLEGNGPLRGDVALRTAPWYAQALRAEGREMDANRVLDRHLAGVLLVETELAPAQRDLLLAANFLGRGREDEAIARLDASVGNGFDLGWGVYCEFSSLPETALLDPLRGSEALIKLGERIEARGLMLRTAA